MFSKTPLQKLSLGAAGAIWLALGSVESANAASFSTGSISQSLELDSIGFGNGEAGENSSDDAIKAALIAGSVLAILFAAGIFNGGSNQESSGDKPDVPVDPEIPQGPQVKTESLFLTPFNISRATTTVATPVPTPALLPGLLALGWKVMQKRRSEQSGAL